MLLAVAMLLGSCTTANKVKGTAGAAKLALRIPGWCGSFGFMLCLHCRTDASFRKQPAS